ncbi:hypothetical protein A9G15_09345 [Gilliamella apis]|uniref:helix-turn-helix transcriptional regulator n=1 Tax=Gilliamella apis TaxID=1970738 RepID=UPI00080DF136|nr:AlpA family transcriptional regulator [Gilliamella apis]OCG07404.1 hypothetical protein A9G15_09345 [Gilliamella apis]
MTVIFKLKTVCDITTLSKATIYREIKQGKFPAPIQLTDRSVGWLMSEIEEWINKKAKNRKGYHLLN